MQLLVAVLLTAAAFTSGSIVKSSGENFELLILHNNDMHARFEQTSQLSGACTTADREAGKCYGGFPRVAHVVKEARRAAQTGEGPPVLYLNAGDTYTGTAWFTIYKWKIAAEFINALQPDAVSLGNNEVDQNENKISSFLENINAPIVATNVNIKSAANKANIQKSIIFNINNVKVGVVGYLTPDSEMLDSVGNVEYIDEVLALTEEVKLLQSLNVNIIIAIGHSSLAKDKEIAQDVPGLDIVISGNKNQFYWNGNTVPTAQETLLVAQESGKTVPIIFSSAYDKYLGSVRLIFNADGEIINYDNKPINLDSSIPQDLPSVEIIKKYNTELVSRSQEVIGTTAVVLDGTSCSREECNFGNFVTDAIVYYYAINFENERWTDAPIAIIHSAAIGNSIAPTNRPASVTRGDVLAALPIEGNLVTVTMNGNVLKEVLEQSVYNYNSRTPSGQFLQFSGIRVAYDLENEPGSRLVSALVRCWNCFVPQFYEIEDNRDYKILMPEALADGQYGYSMLVGLPRVNLNYDEVTCASEYFRMRSPVYPEVAGRIHLSGSASAVSSSLLLVAFISILTNIYN